jgi:acetyl-CoA acetyltransferase
MAVVTGAADVVVCYRALNERSGRFGRVATADGAIELGGRLPINPHGGQLGEAYIHGMNGITEAVRRIRGTSVNQIPGVAPVLVTAGTGVPTSALILGFAG